MKKDTLRSTRRPTVVDRARFAMWLRRFPLRLSLVSLLLSLAGAPLYAADVDDPPLTAKQRAHWAFRAPACPTLPPVRDAGWVRTPVDAFILARLDQAGLQPAPAADRATLLRRVTYDLTGLPPTPDELDTFLRDGR